MGQKQDTSPVLRENPGRVLSRNDPLLARVHTLARSAKPLLPLLQLHVDKPIYETLSFYVPIYLKAYVDEEGPDKSFFRKALLLECCLYSVKKAVLYIPTMFQIRDSL